MHIGPLLGEPASQALRLERLRRRAKAVQVEQVRGAQAGPRFQRLANVAISLPWMSPKAPLLMQSTWSPGRTALATAATSASTEGAVNACAPSGASASRTFQP